MASRRVHKDESNVVDDETCKGIEAMRLRAYEDYLQTVSDMYFAGYGETAEEVFNGLRNVQESALNGPIGGVLTSRFRNPEVIDSWAPKDIALFIAAITRFGRDWDSVGKVLPHKSQRDFVDFYFCVWKCSKLYRNWKKMRKQRGLE